MILLDFRNAQSLVFEDRGLQRKLPEFRPLFDSWTLARQIPALRQLGNRSVLEFLELIEPEHVEIIAEHAGTPVFLDHPDYHLVKEVAATTAQLEQLLDAVDFSHNFAVSRSEENAILTFWR